MLRVGFARPCLRMTTHKCMYVVPPGFTWYCQCIIIAFKKHPCTEKNDAIIIGGYLGLLFLVFCFLFLFVYLSYYLHRFSWNSSCSRCSNRNVKGTIPRMAMTCNGAHKYKLILLLILAVLCIIIYCIHIFLSIDWLKVCHVIKNKLTILQKLGQSRK